MEQDDCDHYARLACKIVKQKSKGVNISVAQVAREQNLNRKTLSKWVKKQLADEAPKCGRPSLLTNEEEDALLSFIVAQDALESGISDHELAKLTSFLLERKGIKRSPDELLSSRFPRDFRRRHSDIIEIKAAKPTEVQRLVAERNFKRTHIFFAQIKKWLEHQKGTGLRGCRIWNTDETALPIPGSRRRKVCGMKGTPSRTVATSLVPHISLVPVVNAAGDRGPMLVLSEERLGFPEGGTHNNVLERAGISYKQTASGWMDQTTFAEWFEKVFVPLVKECRDQEYRKSKNKKALTARHLLLYDGHTSHYNYQTLRCALDNNIDIIVSPSHMTHRVQPLDVSVFQHLKCSLVRSLSEVTSRVQYKELVNNGDLMKLIASSYLKTVTSKIVRSGFRQSGIYPWNPNAALRTIPGWGE